MSKNKGKAHKDRPDLPADKFLPVAIDTAANAEALANAERVVIFTVDGTDYSMPKHPQADIALEYLALEREGRGEEAAAILLERTIGTDGLEALRGVRGLTDKQFEGVMTRVRAIALPKGESRAVKPARR